MGIWRYSETVSTSRYRDLELTESPVCIFCNNLMERTTIPHTAPDEGEWHATVGICQTCGWWTLRSERMPDNILEDLHEGWAFQYAVGSLRNLAVDDATTATDDLRRYLSGRRDELGVVAPRKVEELVASVFRNLGYVVELTSHSGDGGIDIILLRDSGSQQIAVQVKRHKRKIDVSQVRAFFGALPPNRIHEGIFVGTTEFTPGARKFAGKLETMNLARIKLLDGNWLLKALRVPQRPSYRGVLDPEAPYAPLLADPTSIHDGLRGAF